MGMVQDFVAIPSDVQFLSCNSVLQMETAKLGFWWVGFQVVFAIVGGHLLEDTFQGRFDFMDTVFLGGCQI